MNKPKQFFIGIDVSKEWFDAALIIVENYSKGDPLLMRFENTTQGVKSMGKWLHSYGMADPSCALIVMENTGIYHRVLWNWCASVSMPVHIGNAAHIKWSLGIVRGKDDRTDSIRLCQYAVKEHENLKATPAFNPAVIQLKDLYTSRSRLLSQLNSNKVYLKELRKVNDREVQKTLETAYKTAIEGIERAIKKIEVQIKTVIAQNDDFRRNYKLLLSIPGIGHITAVYLICCTANFVARPTGRQLSCYAGLAPFEHTSGKSIRGRTKVHKMANKELKTLLYMGALSNIQHNAEMKEYYERKIAAGKHELSVMNAIKSKMLLRVAAIVTSGRPYVNKSKLAA